MLPQWYYLSLLKPAATVAYGVDSLQGRCQICQSCSRRITLPFPPAPGSGSPLNFYSSGHTMTHVFCVLFWFKWNNPKGTIPSNKQANKPPNLILISHFSSRQVCKQTLSNEFDQECEKYSFGNTERVREGSESIKTMDVKTCSYPPNWIILLFLPLKVYNLFISLWSENSFKRYLLIAVTLCT